MGEVVKRAGGALFKNKEKRNATAPDWSGRLEIDPEVAKAIHDLSLTKQLPILRLVGWMKKSKGAGQTYISLRASIERSGKAPKNPFPRDVADALLLAQTGGEKGEDDEF